MHIIRSFFLGTLEILLRIIFREYQLRLPESVVTVKTELS